MSYDFEFPQTLIVKRLQMSLNNLRCQPRSGTNQSTFLAGTISLLFFYFVLKETFFLTILTSPHVALDKNPKITWLNSTENFKSEELRYVQASKNAPTNTPDKSRFFSFRDQQAAQPEKTSKSSGSLAPMSVGRDQIMGISEISDLHKTVSADVPESGDSRKQNLKKASPIPKAPPNTGRTHHGDGVESTTMDSRNSILDLRINHPEQISSSNNFNKSIGALTKHKSRPKLSTELISSARMKHTQNAPRKGKMAIECRLHPFGIYVQKMLKSIEQQWLLLLSTSYGYIRKMPTPQTFVYRFELNSNGKITDLKLDNHPLEELLAELCRQAIASRAPFGEWSKEMIQDFGHTDQVTIKFEYL